VPGRRGAESLDQQESRVIADFLRHFHLTFREPELLKLALTHRSYLSVTGQGPRESNERLEFLGDSVLGLVTSEYLYRLYPDEHEGQLTKTKSLLVSKAILSRRALSMGLGRFVLMSHSEVESGGRQRLSILADAFESVISAIYLDQGFEEARAFIEYWLLRDSRDIVADKRHRNYKSHLQEYVQSTFRTHPVYRIRSQMGPDHSKLFLVEVLVGRRVLGEGRGNNKKEAEQAAARDALEGVERPNRRDEEHGSAAPAAGGRVEAPDEEGGEGRRGRRGGRGRRGRWEEPGMPVATAPERPAPEEKARGQALERPAPEQVRGQASERRAPEQARGPVPARPAPERPRRPVFERPAPLPEPERLPEMEPTPSPFEEDDLEEIGRPEGPLEERHVDPFGFGPGDEAVETEVPPAAEPWSDGEEEVAPEPEPEPESELEPEPEPEADREAGTPSEEEVVRSYDEREAEEQDEEPAPGPLEPEATPGPRFGRRRGRKR